MAISSEWIKTYNLSPPEIFSSPKTRQQVLHKILSTDISKEADSISHFIVYFMPYNPKTKEVFLVFDHRVGGLWLTPGGHVKTGESPSDAASREINEELGVILDVPELPFFISETIPTNPNRPCKTHYDFWFLVETDGSNFKLEQKEHTSPQWLKISDALKVVSDPATRQALYRLI